MSPPLPHRLKVGFILAKRFSLAAFANFLDVLRLAADEGDRSNQILCQWDILGDVQGEIHASSGLVVQSNRRFGAQHTYDYIVLVGGLTHRTSLSGAARDYLYAHAQRGTALVGVCTGVIMLADLGLLAGYRRCVSWAHHDDYLDVDQETPPDAVQSYVIDRDRLTCAGGISSAYLAAHLVAEHIGAKVAQKALRMLMIEDAPKSNHIQPSSTLEIAVTDPVVRQALLHMQYNLATPLTSQKLAELTGVSKRKLERLFTRTLGQSPGAVSRGLRLRHARSLLKGSSDSVTQIALATGFCDASHLGRLCRQQYGRSPEALRRED
ncbi:MAG: helix-turn-helix domain-containing protein [Pelagimonas sp.]